MLGIAEEDTQCTRKGVGLCRNHEPAAQRLHAIEAAAIGEDDRLAAGAGFQCDDRHRFLAGGHDHHVRGAIGGRFRAAVEISDEMHAPGKPGRIDAALERLTHPCIRAGEHELVPRHGTVNSRECVEKQVRTLDLVQPSHEEHEGRIRQTMVAPESAHVRFLEVLDGNAVRHDVHARGGSAVRFELLTFQLGDRNCCRRLLNEPAPDDPVVDALERGRTAENRQRAAGTHDPWLSGTARDVIDERVQRGPVIVELNDIGLAHLPRKLSEPSSRQEKALLDTGQREHPGILQPSRPLRDGADVEARDRRVDARRLQRTAQLEGALGSAAAGTRLEEHIDVQETNQRDDERDEKRL